MNWHVSAAMTVTVVGVVVVVVQPFGRHTYFVLFLY